MKKVLATFNSESYQELADITIPLKQRYAEKWEYDFHSRVFDGNMERIGWYRFVEILNLLENYDEVFWLDCDAVIMNSAKRADIITGDLICTADLHGLNTGVMIARSVPIVKQLFWVITGGYGIEHFGNHPWGEQAALIHLLSMPPYDRLLNCVPQRRMNSYLRDAYSVMPDYIAGNYEPGDFIIQLAGLPYSQRVSLARDLAASAS